MINPNLLKVEDAFKEDAGRGIVRIDPNVVKALKLEISNAIEISYNIARKMWPDKCFLSRYDKKTAALLYPGKLEDKGTNIIRLDSILRRNLGVNINDLVEIRKIKVKIATELSLQGLGGTRMFFPDYWRIKLRLENRIVMRGDYLRFFGKNLSTSAFGIADYIDLKVMSYYPINADAVRIVKGTRINSFEEAYWSNSCNLLNLGQLIGNKKLRVSDVFEEDVGKGIVRIDPDVIKQQNLKTGNVIEIFYTNTNKKTVALLDYGRSEDRYSNVIRLDKSLRKKLGVNINDFVEIRKIEAETANEVIFSSLDEVVILKNSQELAIKLENRVITIGDIINICSILQTDNLLTGDLVVEDYNPISDAVKIKKHTIIILSEKKHREFNLKEEYLKSINIIKKTILELGTKFNQLELSEILEVCPIKSSQLIKDTIREMIKNHEIYAQYFETIYEGTKSVVFSQQANIEELDKLMSKYKEWEEEKVGKKK